MSESKNISDLSDKIDSFDDDEFKEWDRKQKHKITGMFLRQTTPEILFHGKTFKTGWIPTEEQIAKATEKYNSFMTKGILSGEEASAQGAVVSHDTSHAGNVSVFAMSKDAKDTDKIFEEAAKNCLNSSFSVALERPTTSHILSAADDRSRFLKENKHEEIQLRCRNTVFIVLVMTPSDIAELDEENKNGKWRWVYDHAKSVKDRWLKKTLSPPTPPWYEDRIGNINQTIFSRMIKKGGFFTMAASSDSSLPNLTRVENERYMTIIGEKIICPDYQSHLYRIMQAAPTGSIIMTHITRFNTTDQSFSPDEQPYIDASRGAKAKLGGRRRKTRKKRKRKTRRKTRRRKTRRKKKTKRRKKRTRHR